MISRDGVEQLVREEMEDHELEKVLKGASGDDEVGTRRVKGSARHGERWIILKLK